MTHACLLDLTKEVDQDSIKEMAPWTYYLLSEEDEKKRFFCVIDVPSERLAFARHHEL